MISNLLNAAWYESETKRVGDVTTHPAEPATGRTAQLVTLVLRVVHSVIIRFLLKQAGANADEADSGAATPIQRLGSAANLNINLHCLVLDGAYGAAPMVNRASSKYPRQPVERCMRCCITR